MTSSKLSGRRGTAQSPAICHPPPPPLPWPPPYIVIHARLRWGTPPDHFVEAVWRLIKDPLVLEWAAWSAVSPPTLGARIKLNPAMNQGDLYIDADDGIELAHCYVDPFPVKTGVQSPYQFNTWDHIDPADLDATADFVL